MKVVILGGTGNISKSIVKLLLRQGYDITCYNRGITGIPSGDVHLIKGDRNDRESFEKAMKKGKFDIAIDMICFNRADAESDYKAFKEVQHFIYCSTVCTYGVKLDWLPVSEDHSLRPVNDYGRGKVEADRFFLEAYYSKNFPVTIIRPSTTYGTLQGMVRQVSHGFPDYSWIDRIRKGKPILVCGDGRAIHQFLHVDDAAKGFVGAINKDKCKGQIYNIVDKGYVNWEEYHKLAMKVLGVEVELVGIPLNNLLKYDNKNFFITEELYSHNGYYSSKKIFRDIPEFVPTITLEEGMAQIINYMDQNNMIPNSDELKWEDDLIQAQRQIGKHL